MALRRQDLLPSASPHRRGDGAGRLRREGIRFRLPPGINPPWILRFGASTVPIIQLSLSSKTLNEAALYDYGIFRVRQQLSTVPGTLLPAPYGGKARQIMVDLDQNSMLAKGLTPNDVNNAINSQNLILPLARRRWENATTR